MCGRLGGHTAGRVSNRELHQKRSGRGLRLWVGCTVSRCMPEGNQRPTCHVWSSDASSGVGSIQHTHGGGTCLAHQRRASRMVVLTGRRRQLSVQSTALQWEVFLWPVNDRTIDSNSPGRPVSDHEGCKRVETSDPSPHGCMDVRTRLQCCSRSMLSMDQTINLDMSAQPGWLRHSGEECMKGWPH